jgi:ubiquinone/menaquinone biosynthesis C-methylase UbiE
MLHEKLDRQIAPIGRAAMAVAGFEPGQQVLDIGCGCGESSFEIAGRVAPGRVDGVDISAMLLEIARSDAAAKGLSNVAFAQADAQIHAFAGATYDVAFSRFGVMFFEDPVAAFSNIRPALKPGGRLAFCCWRTPRENQWLSLPMQAVGHLLPPQPRSDLNAPGPFAFADADRVRSILADAGFAAIVIEPLDLMTGVDSLDDSVHLSLRVGQLGAALRQADADDALKAKVEAALRAALQPYCKDGVVSLPAAAWIVSART